MSKLPPPRFQPKPPYSFSGLSLFNQCQLRYWFRYVAGLEERKGKAAAFGTKMHDNVERGIRKLRGKPWDSQTFRFECIAGLNVNERMQQAIAAISRWLGPMWPYIGHAVAPEYRFGIDAQGRSVDYDSPSALVRGIIDLLCMTFPVVVDWKSGEGRHMQMRQMETYALGYRVTFPDVHPQLPVLCAFFLPEANSQIVVQPISQQAMVSAWAWISQTAAEIAGKNWQDPNDWKLSPGSHCRWCAGRSECPAVRGIPVDTSDARTDVPIGEADFSSILRNFNPGELTNEM